MITPEELNELSPGDKLRCVMNSNKAKIGDEVIYVGKFNHQLIYINIDGYDLNYLYGVAHFEVIKKNKKKVIG